MTSDAARDPDSSQRKHIPSVVGYMPLRYVLPMTQLTATTIVGHSLDPQEVDAGKPARTLLMAHQQVAMTSTVIPDHRVVYELTVSERILEKKTITVELDRHRIITGVNSGVSRDLTPVLDIIKTVASLAAPIKGFQPMDSLEERWALLHESLSTDLDNLLASLQRLIGMLSTAMDPAQIALIGTAIQPVKAEIAAIDALRREWMAGHVTSESKTFELTLQQLVRVYRGDSPQGKLPEDLPRDSLREITPEQQDFGATYGVLIAALDLERTAFLPTVLQPPADVPDDHILLRVPRIATIGMYRKRANSWKLDPSTVQSISVVDDFSDLIEISLEGEWFEEHNQQLVLEVDQSIKTWGVTRNSTLGPVLTSVAGVATAAGETYKARNAAKKPTDDEKAATTAKAKLELLKTSSELTKLARGYGLQDEIDLAERLVRIADSS